MRIEFESGTYVFQVGDGVDIPSGDAHRHRAQVLSDVVLALLVEPPGLTTAGQELIHRSVAGCMGGLREYLELGKRRVPGDALSDADRLETMIFCGYDAYFEGDEQWLPCVSLAPASMI